MPINYHLSLNESFDIVQDAFCRYSIKYLDDYLRATDLPGSDLTSRTQVAPRSPTPVECMQEMKTFVKRYFFKFTPKPDMNTHYRLKEHYNNTVFLYSITIILIDA